MAPQEQPEIPEFSDVTEAPPAALSEFSRIAMVFSSPTEAFKDIALRPRWWVPILLIGLLSAIYAFVLDSKVGFESALRPVIQAQAANLTPVQAQAAVAQKRRVALDNDALEATHRLGDLGVVLRWDRLRVEEAAGIIELDLPRGR